MATLTIVLDISDNFYKDLMEDNEELKQTIEGIVSNVQADLTGDRSKVNRVELQQLSYKTTYTPIIKT